VLEAVRMRPGEIEPRTRRWKKCVTLLDSKSPIQGTGASLSALVGVSLGYLFATQDSLVLHIVYAPLQVAENRA
jgi:hypothetical protein